MNIVNTLHKYFYVLLQKLKFTNSKNIYKKIQQLNKRNKQLQNYH